MSQTAAKVRVHLLPPTEGLGQDAPRTAVIVDVLRASTTITTALAAGAEAIVPCLEIADAKRVAAAEGALLGGERGGVRLPGFDLGNSPLEYSTEAVFGRLIAFTTTNGTRALHHSLQAAEILIGAFVNLSAIVRQCCTSGHDVEIVCAGTDGAVSGEDVLFAGLLAVSLTNQAKLVPADDVTRIAMDFSRSSTENPTRLSEVVRESTGGRNLIALGCDADIEFAVAVDRFSIAPAWQPHTGRIA